MLFAAALSAVLLLSSCPNPLPVDLAAQIGDSGAPVITITSPAEDSTYQSTVPVTGRVTDGDGTVQSLVLSVPSAEVYEDLTLADDGSFSCSFSTVGLSSSITITLTATDWNGNESTCF